MRVPDTAVLSLPVLNGSGCSGFTGTGTASEPSRGLVAMTGESTGPVALARLPARHGAYVSDPGLDLVKLDRGQLAPDTVCLARRAHRGARARASRGDCHSRDLGPAHRRRLSLCRSCFPLHSQYRSVARTIATPTAKNLDRIAYSTAVLMHGRAVVRSLMRSGQQARTGPPSLRRTLHSPALLPGRP